MNQQARIFVAGGATLLGSALLRQLAARGFINLVGVGPDEPCLTDALAVEQFFSAAKPDYVFVAGGPSGGIAANQRRPADLMRDNLLVATSILDSAHYHGVTKLCYLASACVYPRLCPQPMTEDALQSGPLEPTNEAYATAKLAGIVLCKAYRQQHNAPFVSAISTNAFGPGDDFRPEEGHVIPALIARFHEAKIGGQDLVTLWGTGTPRREFLYADDIADGCLTIMAHYDDATPINLSGGTDVSIAELAGLIAEVVEFRGRILFDTSRPDGMPLKRLDASRLQAMGWRPTTPFRQALEQTFRWYLKNATVEEATHAC